MNQKEIIQKYFNISEVHRIYLSKEGYTKNGSYFGFVKGENLYEFRYSRNVIACGSSGETVERETQKFLRAPTIKEAKKKLKTEYPSASFDF